MSAPIGVPAPGPFVGNASSSKQTKKAKRKEGALQAAVGARFRSIMETPEGRDFMWWLIGQCGTFRTSYEPGMDSLQAAFNAGRQDVGHLLLAQSEAHHDLYLLMQSEAARAAKLAIEMQPPEEMGYAAERTDSTDEDEHVS